MASCLSIKVTEAIEANTILRYATLAYQTIMLESLPRIVFEPEFTQIPFRFEGRIISYFEGFSEDFCELIFVWVPTVKNCEDPEEEGWWISPTLVASWKNERKKCLAAILAFAFGKTANSNIYDETCFWTDFRILDPDSFIQNLKITSS
jgi:hypothetical protein